MGENIWWSRVSNAVRYLGDITEAVLAGRSVLLQYDGSLPWYTCFHDRLKSAVIAGNSEKRFEETGPREDPGAFLLNTYCRDDRRSKYRPAKGYAEFLAESDDIVLHDLFLWVRPGSAEELRAWADFISKYTAARGKGKNRAVFILEWNRDGKISGKKGIQTFRLTDYIGAYDRIIFAMLAASETEEQELVKTYLAELAANVIKDDMELCAAALQHEREFLADPYGLIQKLLAAQERSDGTPFYFTGSRDDVRRHVWLAQIRTVYPETEAFREDLIRKYYAQLRTLVPVYSTTGEINRTPEEIELGTLKFLADDQRLSLSSPDYYALARYREARNRLSHLSVLTIDEIRELRG